MFSGNILKCCTNALGQFFTFHNRFQNQVRTLFLPLLIWNLRKLCCKSCLFGQGTKVHLCFPMSNINLIFFNIFAFDFSNITHFSAFYLAENSSVIMTDDLIAFIWAAHESVNQSKIWCSEVILFQSIFQLKVLIMMRVLFSFWNMMDVTFGRCIFF